MKQTIILILLFFTIHFAHAQVDFAIKAGGNLSTFALPNHPSSDGYPFDSGIGFQLGASGFYAIDENFNLTTDFMYVLKGPESRNLNYLNLPVVLGYRLGSFNLELGAEAGILLFAKFRSPSGDKINFTEFFNRLDLSVIAGTTYSINEKIGVNLRYGFGIIPNDSYFYTDDGVDGFEVKQYNRSIQLSLLYKIKGK